MAPAPSRDQGRDPGLQPQRTGLAWWRTALSVFLVGLLCLRTALTQDSPTSLLAAVLAIAAAVVMTLRGWQRPAYNAHIAEVTTRGDRRLVVGVAGAVAAIAVLELAGLALRHLTSPLG